MSAWMVSNAHIDLLATAYVRLVDASADAQEIGAQLIRENSESICYRYSHYPEDCDNARAQAADYTFREWPGEIAPRLLSKSVACFDYQACEHPAYEESEGKRIVAALEAKAPEFNSGSAFDALPWGVEESDRPETVN